MEQELLSRGDVFLLKKGQTVYMKTPVNADEPLISFYQTGCFTAMIENPKIVSRV